MPIGDVERLSQLFKTPDVSMRDDYDVAVLEVDTLLDCTVADRDVFGVRLTSGGFNGAVGILAFADRAASATPSVATPYSERTTREERAVVAPSEGTFLEPAESAWRTPRLLYDLICCWHLPGNFVFQRPEHLMSRCAIERRVFFVAEPMFDSDAGGTSQPISSTAFTWWCRTCPGTKTRPPRARSGCWSTACATVGTSNTMSCGSARRWQFASPGTSAQTPSFTTAWTIRRGDAGRRRLAGPEPCVSR